MADAQDTTDTQAAGQPDVTPWQFSLWDLFLLVTALAVALAIAARVGPGSLSLTLGLILAWQNVRGKLAFAQSTRLRPRVFALGWLLLLLSLCLPAAKGCNGKYLYGWNVAYQCAVVEIVPLVEEEFWSADGGDGWLAWLYVTALNSANLLMLLSPWFLRSLQREHGHRFTLLFALACIPVWTVTWTEEWLIGCYAWQASFAVLLAAQRIRGPTWWAMFSFATVLLIPFLYRAIFST